MLRELYDIGARFTMSMCRAFTLSSSLIVLAATYHIRTTIARAHKCAKRAILLLAYSLIEPCEHLWIEDVLTVFHTCDIPEWTGYPHLSRRGPSKFRSVMNDMFVSGRKHVRRAIPKLIA